jgi:hypothetical protein
MLLESSAEIFCRVCSRGFRAIVVQVVHSRKLAQREGRLSAVSSITGSDPFRRFASPTALAHRAQKGSEFLRQASPKVE